MKNLERFLNIGGGFIFRGSEDLRPIKSILCSTGLLRVKSQESVELATNFRIWSFTTTEKALVLFVKSSLRFVSSPSQESSQCWIVNIGARQESLQCAPSVCSLKASSLFSLSISATHNSHESSGGQNIKFHLNHLWNNHNRLRCTKIIILCTAMCRYIFWCNLKDPI